MDTARLIWAWLKYCSGSLVGRLISRRTDKLVSFFLREEAQREAARANGGVVRVGRDHDRQGAQNEQQGRDHADVLHRRRALWRAGVLEHQPG